MELPISLNPVVEEMFNLLIFQMFQQHHHQYLSAVMSKPAELPKYDFAKLKKQMPEHAVVLDKLQKQYEGIKIPFHTVPEQFIKVRFSFFF